MFECLEVMRCYRTALDVSGTFSFVLNEADLLTQLLLFVLRSTASTDLLLAVVDDLRRHLDLWACMDALTLIVHTLFDVHNAWKSKGIHIRFLVDLLLNIDDGRMLSSASRNQVVEGAMHFAQVRL